MDSASQFDELFTKMRAALQAVRSGNPSTVETEYTIPQPPVVGRSQSGQIVVTLAGNDVERVEIDPRALHAGIESLGASVAEAVNAALYQLRANSAEAAAEVDTAALAKRLDELQTESLRSMTVMSGLLSEAVQRISQTGR